MAEPVEVKLRRLDTLHQERTRIQREEEALAAELATSPVRGVRTEMARILEVSVEALRLRYGAVKSVAAVGHGRPEVDSA